MEQISISQRLLATSKILGALALATVVQTSVAQIISCDFSDNNGKVNGGCVVGKNRTPIADGQTMTIDGNTYTRK